MRVPNNGCGGQWPLGGNTYAGIYGYARGGEYREYIETTLTSPMIPGQPYRIAFNVSLAEKSRDSIASLGAYLSVGEAAGSTGAWTALPYSPQIVNTGGIISDETNWVQIAGTYVAAGGEDHITIGNFRPDAGLQIANNKGLQGRKILGAYYYIDDVSVTCLCTARPVIQTQPTSVTVACGQIATLSGAAYAPCGQSYRWVCDDCFATPTILQNNSSFSGTSTGTLQVSAAAAAQFKGKRFRLESYNDCGVVSSSVVTVHTIPPPLTTEPSDVYACPPEDVSFTVAGTGSPLTYQWYWIPAGQTTPVPFPANQNGNRATLSFKTAAGHCGAQVYCEVTGPCGTTTSRRALIRCCDCTPPPANMALWLPFDQVAVISGNGVTRNVVSGYGGVLLPTSGGPTLTAGQFAGNSLLFDGVNDYVRVQSHDLIDIDQGDLSVDAWIALQSDSPGLFVVTDKRFDSGSTRGYHMYILSSGMTYRVGFQLADGAFTNFVSLPNPALVPGAWVHIAVTVDRDSTTGGRFYVNGVPAGVFDPTGRQGSLSNTSPFTVGARSASPTGFFFGFIDEVEVFPRALSATQVAAIAGAKAVGKCKQFAQAYPATIYCNGASATTIGAYVFNFTQNSVVFPGTFAGLLCPFAPPNLPLPVTVPLAPWSSGQVSVTATKPAMGAGTSACYTATFVGANGPFSCSGTIFNRPDINCTAFPAMAIPVTLGSHQNVGFSFGNAGGQGAAFAWRIEAQGPDGQASRTVSINGAEAGAMPQGEILIPPGGTFELSLDASFASVDAIGATFLVLTTDTDHDGVYEPAAGAALLCMVPSPCDAGTLPVIELEPANTAVCPDRDAAFTVVAAGQPLTFQWQHELEPGSDVWTDLAEGANDGIGLVTGALGNAMTISQIGPAAPGAYRCVLTNDCGSLSTSSAGLTIKVQDVNGDGGADQLDVVVVMNAVTSGEPTTAFDPDFNSDGNVNQDDVVAFVNWIAGGECP